MKVRECHAMLFFENLYDPKVDVKPRANGPNIVGCYMLRPFAHLVACCWMLLRSV